MEKPREAMLCEKKGKGMVQCRLCARYCLILDGKKGFCAVRENRAGKLFSLSWGKSTGFALDPIEKKPFYHFHPGTYCLSFGTPGCNFRCLGCQNWDLSQAPRKDGAKAFGFEATTPKQIAELALKTDGNAGIAYTYSEPTIFFEYAYDTIKETKKLNPSLYHVFVSNGYFSKECFDLVRKERLLNAIRMDLKGFNEKFYEKFCSARLEPVLESIKRVAKEKSWLHLELICLIVPGWNDSQKEIREMCEWIAAQGKEIPVHFIRFFPHYELQDVPSTPIETLLKAREIALGEGLQYVYVGNTALADVENTFCPNCKSVVVERSMMQVTGMNLSKEGNCGECGKKINVVL
jgi:pyruvate formate lyase activating enzyme